MLTPLEEAEAERRQLFLLKQLVFFWPLVSNPDDVDRVVHLNYWLCLSYAWWNLLSGLVLIFLFHLTPASPIPILLVVLTGLFYFLGGNAVRRNSVAAAWAMAAYAFVPVLERLLEHKFNGNLFLFFLGSLVVLRGTILTARWQRQHGNDAADPLRIEQVLPLQLDTSFTRSMADRWPAQLWPRLQWLFWLTGAVLLAEPILYAVLLLQDRLKI